MQKSAHLKDSKSDVHLEMGDAKSAHHIMHQSIPSTNISPQADPGEFFKVVKFPAPGRKFLRNYGPGAKK